MSLSTDYPCVELADLPETEGVDLELSFTVLQMFYDNVDGTLESSTSGLDLPCSKGCSTCCHESVFLTPLEFYYIWNYVQQELRSDLRNEVIEKALALYQQNQKLIESFEKPPPDGELDHFVLARLLRFTCPFLSEEGACQVYPVRELFARLFGSTFDNEGGIYGCYLVKEHMEGQHATLLTARKTAQYLNDLPLTHKRQVFPYYIHQLYQKTEESEKSA